VKIHRKFQKDVLKDSYMSGIYKQATGFTLYTSLRSSTGVQDLPGIKLIALISCLKGLMLIEKINVLKVYIYNNLLLWLLPLYIQFHANLNYFSV